MTTQRQPNAAVSKAASFFGTYAALARAVKVTPQTVNDWAHGRKPVPVRQCVAIEAATAKAVLRKELRPNDWADYWPELAHEAAPTQPQPA